MNKICLIVTSSADFSLVNCFFSSLNRQGAAISICVVFVNQNQSTYQGFLFNKNISFHVVEVNKVIPLSVARNIAIRHVDVSEFDVIAFPDDDCWYGDSLIEDVFHCFENDVHLNVLCTNVLDPSNNKTYGGRPKGVITAVNKRNIFTYPISVGIFISVNDVVAHDLYFDEKLGAGTAIGSGEETELIYRLINRGLICKYVGDLFVFHPVIDSDYSNKDISKYFKYGVGFGCLTRRMVNDGDFSILVHFFYILLRTFAGFVFSINNDINRKVYFSRFKGVILGFFRDFK